MLMVTYITTLIGLSNAIGILINQLQNGESSLIGGLSSLCRYNTEGVYITGENYI